MRLIGAALAALVPLIASAETITGARFAAPTGIYRHGVLGDAIEWIRLEITVRSDGAGQETTRQFTLPQDHVYEDTGPRLYDVTGDGAPEVIVVETDVRLGAALAIYGPTGKLAETRHIGQTNRWLAPVGAADLDGDGTVEIAYVDRPHLARTLRILRFNGRDLTEIASVSGLTNHRIGDPTISGGIRSCAGQREIILAAPDWNNKVAVRFDGIALTARPLGAMSFDQALICR